MWKQSRWAAATFLVAVTLLPAQTPAAPKTADEWVKIGYDHASAGRFADAEKAYNAALQLNSKHPYANGNMAYVHLHYNRPEAAVRSASLGLTYGNTHPGVYLNRAAAYYRMGAKDKKYYDSALKDADVMLSWTTTSKFERPSNEDRATAYDIKGDVYDALKVPELAEEMRRKAKLIRNPPKKKKG